MTFRLFSICVILTGVVIVTSCSGLAMAAKPQPQVTSVSPAVASAGTTAVTIQVSGESFSRGSVVMWNGQPRTTTMITDRLLKATLQPSDTASPGTAKVYVKSRWGTPSNAVTFTVVSAEGGTVGVPFDVPTTSIAAAVVGTPYSQPLTAVGGEPPYQWSVVSGSLPPGISLSSNGVLAGTPTSSGQYAFSVQARDLEGATETRAYTLAVATATATAGPTSSSPTITTSSLPTATVGASYSATIAVSGGVPPYYIMVTSGSLPPGISLSSTGALSGTPNSAGTYTFTVDAEDRQPVSGNKTLQLTVQSGSGASALSITTTSLNPATVGSAYSASLSASGGKTPYSWSLASGSLPSGITLNSDGTLSGTSSATGTSSFTAKVTDAAGASATRVLQLAVNATAVVINTSSLPSATAGSAYSSTLSASGGVPPYSWSVLSGSLPAGLSLSSGGVISGTPSGSTTASFSVQAADSLGSADTQSLTLTVASAGSSPAPSSSPSSSTSGGWTPNCGNYVDMGPDGVATGGDAAVHLPPNYGTMAKPATGSFATADPTFGCKMQRYPGYGIVYPTWRAIDRDDRYLLVTQSVSPGAYTVLSLANGSVVCSNLPMGDNNEPRWGLTAATRDYIYYASGSAMKRYNVQTCSDDTAYTWTPVAGQGMDDGESGDLELVNGKEVRSMGFGGLGQNVRLINLTDKTVGPVLNQSGHSCSWTDYTQALRDGSVLVMCSPASSRYDGSTGAWLNETWNQNGTSGATPHSAYGRNAAGNIVALSDSGYLTSSQCLNGGATGVTVDNLATQTSLRCFLAGMTYFQAGWWPSGGYFSIANQDERHYLASFAKFDTSQPGTASTPLSSSWQSTWKPFLNEIVACQLDGSRCWRLTHTRVQNRAYGAGEMPNLSMSGRYVCFNSDWGDGVSRDTYCIDTSIAGGKPHP